MTLAPLFAADGAIRLHAFAAMTAFALGVVHWARPKERFRIVRSAGCGLYSCSRSVSAPSGFIQSNSGGPGARFTCWRFSHWPCADRRTACAAASRSPAPHRDAFIVLWRIGDRRTVHTLPGPDHAHGSDRSVTLVPGQLQCKRPPTERLKREAPACERRGFGGYSTRVPVLNGINPTLLVLKK